MQLLFTILPNYSKVDGDLLGYRVSLQHGECPPDSVRLRAIADYCAAWAKKLKEEKDATRLQPD